MATSYSDMRGSDHCRATTVSARFDAQQKKLNLVMPAATIDSIAKELRSPHSRYKAKKISEVEYIKAIQEEIDKVVKLQEEFEIDVLVYGEPKLSGFAFTVNEWVQSHGSCCVKPPIIYGDVSRPKLPYVFWSTAFQSMVTSPMKGMLLGLVTILKSFVRNDQPRFETCYQIALAIKEEVEDLEKAGINVFYIDELALRDNLPLRKSKQASYFDWVVHSFRITNCGVKDTTQIRTHTYYSQFSDLPLSIINKDVDVVTIENCCSDESVFGEGVNYGAVIGPGVYDIVSPRILSAEQIADSITKKLATNIVSFNSDYKFKTREHAGVKRVLENMVTAVELLRTEFAHAMKEKSE
ncbi:hypothetical protein ACJRO7_007298 [Eucalyptus globulus]|uniref:Cobalamin-independent methionine synthase MetE C-terminal/archaeal domain-containing protein n=1 Tax=Eucalyptus globulus TaxID=34317 RepID=A0ABD3ILM4_EUCGL